MEQQESINIQRKSSDFMLSIKPEILCGNVASKVFRVVVEVQMSYYFEWLECDWREEAKCSSIPQQKNLE